MRLYEFVDDGTLDRGLQNSGFSEQLQSLQKLDKSYVQIERLARAFRTGNFGYLINKPYGRLSETDIQNIKLQIYSILNYNSLLVGEDIGSSADGDERLRLMGHLIAHGFEATCLTVLTGVFAGMTFSGIITGAMSWSSLLTGGLALGTAALLGIQVKDIYAILAAGKLMDIVQTYEAIGEPEVQERSWIRRFLDWIEGKSPRQIHRETESEIRRASSEMQVKFNRMISDLPKTISYYDNDGVEHQYPVANFFEV